MFWQLFLDKACLALTVAMGGALVLLLVGTQILDWYWLVLLALAGLGVGLYQMRGKVPSLYRVAQHIDRKSGLADALSTAFYFGGHPDSTRQSLVELQRKSAEEVASSVNLQAAIPYQRSRYLLPAGLLAAGALTLFVVRYAMTGSLDLNGSLVALAGDSFFSTPTELAKNDPKNGKLDAKAGDNTVPQDQAKNDDQGKDENPLPDSMMEPQNEDNPEASAEKGDTQQTKEQNKEGEEQGNDSSKSPQDDKNQDSSNSDKQGSQDSKSANQNSKEPSALDKLRDALANLMNKQKPDSSKSGQQNSQQKGKAEKADKAEKQMSQKSGESSSAEQGQQQDENAQQQQSDAKGGQSPQKNQEAASSQGDKIGDKTLKNTEALQAMGKISELMGKRAENLKGEVMIEVGQTKQQLKTAWSANQANHAEGGGEVHRDEVPLMYQQYVERYFEELRKTPEGGAHVPKAAPPAPKSTTP